MIGPSILAICLFAFIAVVIYVCAKDEKRRAALAPFTEPKIVTPPEDSVEVQRKKKARRRAEKEAAKAAEQRARHGVRMRALGIDTRAPVQEQLDRYFSQLGTLEYAYSIKQALVLIAASLYWIIMVLLDLHSEEDDAHSLLSYLAGVIAIAPSLPAIHFFTDRSVRLRIDEKGLLDRSLSEDVIPWDDIAFVDKYRVRLTIRLRKDRHVQLRKTIFRHQLGPPTRPNELTELFVGLACLPAKEKHIRAILEDITNIRRYAATPKAV